MPLKKTKGIEMFRLMAGQAIGRNKFASFDPEQLTSILQEIDQLSPRSHRTIPVYVKKKKEPQK
jgi:hypothetical protein